MLTKQTMHLLAIEPSKKRGKWNLLVKYPEYDRGSELLVMREAALEVEYSSPVGLLFQSIIKSLNARIESSH